MAGKITGIGIIGASAAAREAATALQQWPTLVQHPTQPALLGVSDLRTMSLDWFQQISTVDMMVTDYRQLLQRKDIDVVYVDVPADEQEAICTDVIRAGKDLFVERPFGKNRDAADELIAEISESTGSFVRCASVAAYSPGAQAAISYIRSGALGQLIEASFRCVHTQDGGDNSPKALHARRDGGAGFGVLNDLGLAAWHVPLRLGWVPANVYASLHALTEDPFDESHDGFVRQVWDNAVLQSWVEGLGDPFTLTVETKRVAPGEKDTWSFQAIGRSGGVRYHSKNSTQIETFRVDNIPGIGNEEVWQTVDVGRQSVWPTVTTASRESGRSDAVLQMWAAFLAERNNALPDGFGTARPEEAALTHAISEAAVVSHSEGHRVTLVP